MLATAMTVLDQPRLQRPAVADPALAKMRAFQADVVREVQEAIQRHDVVVVGMIQNVAGSSPTGGSPQVRPLSRQLVYRALVDPKK